MLNLDREQLRSLYQDKEMTPYQIAEQFGCNHKTVRSYLKKYEISLRTVSEYNFLARRNYTSPSEDAVMSTRSVAAHVAYLCEGWHTEKSNCVSFCNQDSQLIDLVAWLLKVIYQTNYKIIICHPEGSDCSDYQKLYPEAKLRVDNSRKNPILRIQAGGKMLVRDLVQNCYKVLGSLS